MGTSLSTYIQVPSPLEHVVEILKKWAPPRQVTFKCSPDPQPYTKVSAPTPPKRGNSSKRFVQGEVMITQNISVRTTVDTAAIFFSSLFQSDMAYQLLLYNFYHELVQTNLRKQQRGSSGNLERVELNNVLKTLSL